MKKISLFLLKIIIPLVFVVLMHLLAYKTNVSLRTASDSFFVVGSILTLFSLIFMTKANKLLYGIRYTLGAFFRAKKREMSFIEFYEEKSSITNKSSTLFFVIYGLVLVVVAIVLALMHVNG